jgi:hypothetical protein
MNFRGRFLVPGLFLLAGLVAAFSPMLFSGLSLMQTDPGDTRHLNFVLEHGYRWAAGWPSDADLWSPPMFWPERNTAAYSEVLLGVMPFYAGFRVLGVAPDTSLQLFTLLVSVLNFAAFFLFLRKALSLSTTASSFGAFLFAFGSVRNVQVGHQHLLAQFFTVAALYACVRLFGESAVAGRRRTLTLGAFVAALVAQVYAGFYLAWFLALALAVALVWALALPATRRRLLATWKTDVPWLAFFGLLGALALWPMASHYLEAVRTVGLRSYEGIVPLLPKPLAYLDTGNGSWVWGWASRAGLFSSLEPFESEKRLGLGLFTSAFMVAGLIIRRKNPAMRVVLLTSGTLIALSLLYPGGFTLWKLVHDHFPGGGAIRAVSRVGLVLLVTAALGLAFAIERFAASRRSLAVALAALAVVLEQGQTMPSYDKKDDRDRVARLSRAIPAGCEAFFYSPVENRRPPWETHVDAMWAGMTRGISTVNGYSSNLPPGFLPLFDHSIQKDRPTDASRLRGALDAWLDAHGKPRDSACWVRLPEIAQ